MPRETEKTNTERVQELYDSFAKGDFEAIRDITDPDMELHEPKGIAGGGTHHGFSEIGKNVFSKTGNEREDVSVVPERYVEDGDTVVVLLTVSEDDLDTETGRSTNTYSYRLRDLKTGDTLPMAVRHQDFVLPKIGSSSLSRSIR